MAGKGQRGVGSAGSSFDVDQYDFPGVPYTADDFTSSSLCTSLDGETNPVRPKCCHRSFHVNFTRRGRWNQFKSE